MGWNCFKTVGLMAPYSTTNSIQPHISLKIFPRHHFLKFEFEVILGKCENCSTPGLQFLFCSSSRWVTFILIKIKFYNYTYSQPLPFHPRPMPIASMVISLVTEWWLRRYFITSADPLSTTSSLNILKFKYVYGI